MTSKPVWIFTSILVILGLLVGSCAAPAPSPTPTAKPSPAPTSAPAPAPAPSPTAKPSPTPTPAPSPKATLPKEMLLTSYDLGTSGYVQTAALAEGLAKKFGIKIRVVPAATSVGRLASIRNGTAFSGLVGDDAYFAALGIEEFCTYDWGPQDLRVIGANLLVLGMAVPANIGVKTWSDLKGKRIPWIPGAATTNIKLDAYLAFGKLTWNDVVKTQMSSYAAALKGLVEGKVDAVNATPGASGVFELQASPKGLYWLEHPAADKEGWARLQQIAPFMSPIKVEAGAGIKPGETKEMTTSRYNLITYSKADEEMVYQFLKAVDESYSLYKDINPDMKSWELKIAGKTPTHAPFHPGAIRYLKERGIWTPADDTWNTQRIDLTNRLQKAWVTVRDEATEKKIKESDLPAYWEKRRKEIVGQ